MSAPMMNHVLVNQTHRLSIKHGIGLIIRTNILYRINNSQNKFYSSQGTHKKDLEIAIEDGHKGQSEEDNDFFGVKHFVKSEHENILANQEKGNAVEKYKLQDRQKPKTFDIVNVSYGSIRLDPRVLQQFRKSDQDIIDERKARKRSIREQRRRKTDSSDNTQTSNINKFSEDIPVSSEIYRPEYHTSSSDTAHNSSKVSSAEYNASSRLLDDKSGTKLHLSSSSEKSEHSVHKENLDKNDLKYSKPLPSYSVAGLSTSYILHDETDTYSPVNSQVLGKVDNTPNASGKKTEKILSEKFSDISRKEYISTSFGKTEDSASEKSFNVDKNFDNYVDQQYFGSYHQSSNVQDGKCKTVIDNTDQTVVKQVVTSTQKLKKEIKFNFEKLNFIDQEYFGSYNHFNMEQKENSYDDISSRKDDACSSNPGSSLNTQTVTMVTPQDSKYMNKSKSRPGTQNLTFEEGTHSKPHETTEVENNLIEDQYFGTLNQSKNMTGRSRGQRKDTYTNSPNLINDYFPDFIKAQVGISKSANAQAEKSSHINNLERTGHNQVYEAENNKLKKDVNVKPNKQVQQITSTNKQVENKHRVKEEQLTTTEKAENKHGVKEEMLTASVKAESSKRKVNEGPMTSAEKAALNIRSEMNNAKTDSKDADEIKKVNPSKVLNQSKALKSSLRHMTLSDVAELLHQNIEYNKNDIIAINKPYGLASYNEPNNHVSISQCLEKLKDLIDPDLEKLHLVNVLDKECTGIVLLAKTEQMAFQLKSAFKSGQVERRYLIVTKGIPSPTEGIIDIPMAEGTVDGKYRMELRPVGYCKQKDTLKAVTKYKVLASHENAAFVECIPLTGVKHQIRAHMFFGLNTPILGDHKFSHVSKLAPQELSGNMLARLNLRQAEVRHLPIHIHARSVLIPEFLNGQNFFVRCLIPNFFVKNMKKLKLDFKEHLS